ncbi:2-oxoacid:ferredoxin oxidoreductase subunit beta [bacterium]|nr:2-oxoacid:ferredoxin oxidoreductase subunit beta [bacterium]
MKSAIHDYLRPKKKFPHVWCPGCGHGIILASIVRAIEAAGKNRDEVVVVSGIGCSSRAPVYVDFSSIHSTHGRALTFATGVKVANPKLTVIVISGDGDGMAIGGNHFIHACRRNIDLTMIVFNNNIYGMTGGQASPTMPQGDYASTAPFGTLERPFDVCKLANASGANFVARGVVTSPIPLEKHIKKGIEKKGFSVIDVAETCPTIYNFFNKTGNPLKMMKDLKAKAIPVQKANTMTEEELKGKIVTGVFADRYYPDFTTSYDKIIMDSAKRSMKDEESI